MAAIEYDSISYYVLSPHHSPSPRNEEEKKEVTKEVGAVTRAVEVVDNERVFGACVFPLMCHVALIIAAFSSSFVVNEKETHVTRERHLCNTFTYIGTLR